MTHETKAGLLVSCSFLCLVGGVVYVKMTQGDVVSASSETAQSKELPWPVAPPDAVSPAKGAAAPGTAEPPGAAGHLTEPGKLPGSVIQVKGTEAKGEAREPAKRENPADVAPPPSPPLGGTTPPASPAGMGNAAGAPEPVSAPPQPHGVEPTTKDDPFSHENALPAAAVRTGGPASAEPASVPAPEGTPLSGAHGTPPDPAPPAPSHEFAAPHAPEPPPASGNPLGAGAPAPVPTASDSTPAGGPPHAPDAPPSAGIAVGTTTPPPAHEAIPGGSPVGSSNPPVPTTAGPANPASSIPPAPPSPGTDMRPTGDAAPPATPGTPATGGVILGAPHSQANPPGNSTPGVMPPDSRIARPPEADTIPPSAATLPPGTQLVQGTPPTTTPLGTPPVVASPPIPVPVVGGAGGAGGAALIRAPAMPGGPLVESFDEETHVCKANDNFASICQEKYHSDKYAQALLMFNRSHPLAADGIRGDPPTLRPGQPVYIPPLEILEKRYPALIGNPAPAAIPVPGVGAPPTGGALLPASGGHTALPGAGLPASGGLTAIPATVHSSPVTPVGERQYTVQAKPETFYEIAKAVLGDGYRWSDIWRLNPSFASNAPLPVGTVVRVPVQ